MSTDDQGLLSLQLHLQNRLEDLTRLVRPTEEHTLERGGIVSLLSWIEEFREYRRLGKLLSTYTHYPTRQDGRIHTRFSISGTATGRLASSDPNLQNIPKKDVDAREPFVAPPGFIFLSADYTNLEVWVMAYECGDTLLLSQLRSGIKIHDANVKLLFDLEPDHPDFTLAKRAAKIFQFGKIQYGGSVNEIYEKVILDVPKLALTRPRFLAAVAKWEGEHPGYTNWAARVKREVLETRRVKVPGGRIRVVYGSDRDILKQALNTPIQGGAASIVNQATIRIRPQLKGMQSGLVLQIHDELLVECALDELAEVRHIVREEMERPVGWWGSPVTFPTSQATGKTWADCYRKED